MNIEQLKENARKAQKVKNALLSHIVSGIALAPKPPFKIEDVA